MDHPHGNGLVRAAGPAVAGARAAAILLHGRGASAVDILALAPQVGLHDVAYFAPEADGHSWYPYSFMAPLERNQPYLDSALRRVGELVSQVRAAGVPTERVVLLGFSQGACLVLEYAARNAQRFGGLVGLSGGLIGPSETPRTYPDSLDGTPVFLGCSDVDPHIPLERVHETAQVLERMGGDVTARIYPGWIHAVNDEEIDAVRDVMARIR